MEEIFDRKMFNRLYFEWFSEVYKKNPEVAIEGDKQVIPRLGKKMAQRIKEKFPENTCTIDYMFEALKQSHWFQEDVELVEKKDNYLILQTKECTFQKYWIKKFSKYGYRFDEKDTLELKKCKDRFFNNILVFKRPFNYRMES